MILYQFPNLHTGSPKKFMNTSYFLMISPKDSDSVGLRRNQRLWIMNFKEVLQVILSSQPTACFVDCLGTSGRNRGFEVRV